MNVSRWIFPAALLVAVSLAGCGGDSDTVRV
jgi:predicted small lipoprotein YifL